MMQTTITTKTTGYKLALDRNDILKAARDASPALEIPDNASVYFVVPGGGDWSGMATDIDGDFPVYISWEVREESCSE